MAPLSNQLLVTIYSAQEALRNSDIGELVLPARRNIWSAMGPRIMDGAKAIIGPGVIRRANLAILCAQHVLPIWRQSFPANDKPDRMLTVAREYLAQKIDFKTVWDMNNWFWSELDDLQSIGVAAGYAAAQAVTASLSDERFGVERVERELSDRDLDPYEWDAGLYASVAYAGSAPWEGKPGASERREFWEWYISEAVSQAWDSAP